MLQVKHITFGYSKQKVLDHINFDIKPGENIAVIGESGSGKSTLLKLIYGEHDLDDGEIHWKQEQILGPKYNLVIGYDFMKYVSQEFDLMPYTTVEENIAKHLSRFYPKQTQQRTTELVKVVELEGFENTKVKNLSGGQKQRVALARALADQPEILLLDEPFSHIDNFKKHSLRRNLFNHLKQNNIACLVATHDKDDVMGFADEMMVLHNKNIIEKGRPQQLYTNPKEPFIASFFGEFNLLNDAIYYAHQIKVVQDSNLKGTVKQSYFNGRNWLIEVEHNSKLIYVEHHSEIKKGLEVYISLGA